MLATLLEIENKVYAESGCEVGNCPLCNSVAYSEGLCDDCGIDLLTDWALGADDEGIDDLG